MTRRKVPETCGDEKVDAVVRIVCGAVVIIVAFILAWQIMRGRVW